METKKLINSLIQKKINAELNNEKYTFQQILKMLNDSEFNHNHIMNTIDNMNPRDFEILIDNLYKKMDIKLN